MKDIYVFGILKSRYCKAVFVLSLVVAYFILPREVFESPHFVFGIAFMLTFALLSTCLVRNVKERLFAAKAASGSLLGAFAAIVGWSALQVCTVSCTAGFGAALLSAFLPSMFMHFLISYSIPLIVISLLAQIFAIYRMNCLGPSKVPA